MRVNGSFGNQAKIVAARQSVYVGRDRIGDVAQRDDGYEARDRRGHVIGVFETARMAADAISATDNPIPKNSRRQAPGPKLGNGR